METRQRIAHYASIITAVLVGVSYFADQFADFLTKFIPS